MNSLYVSCANTPGLRVWGSFLHSRALCAAHLQRCEGHRCWQPHGQTSLLVLPPPRSLAAICAFMQPSSVHKDLLIIFLCANFPTSPYGRGRQSSPDFRTFHLSIFSSRIAVPGKMKNLKNPIISVCKGRLELSNLPCSQSFRLAIFPQTTTRFSGSQVQTSLITEVMEMKFKSRQSLT